MSDGPKLVIRDVRTGETAELDLSTLSQVKRIVDVARMYCAMHGYDVSAVMLKDVLDFVEREHAMTPEQRAAVMAEYLQGAGV